MLKHRFVLFYIGDRITELKTESKGFKFRKLKMF